jgi:hypothetical protein
MAQQPRQQRIGFYGKFTPTALDTSEADKMRALAGLGETIADTSLSIAKPMVEGERAKQGAQAAEGADRDPVTGKVLEVPEMDAWKIGGSQFNAAAQQKANKIDTAAANSYKTGIMEDINAGIFQAAQDNPSNVTDYLADTKALFDGMKAAIPEEFAQDLEIYFNTQNRQQSKAVVSAQQKIILDEESADWILQKSMHEKSVLNLIADGENEQANLLQQEFMNKTVPGFIASGAASKEDVVNYNLKLEFDSKVAQVNGGAQKIIDDETLTVAQKKLKAEQYVNAFDDVDLPMFTPEEKTTAREELVSLFEDAEKSRIAELKEARIVDLETQYANLTEYDDNILNSTVLSTEEKKATINKLRYENKIPEEDAKLRISYLNSVEKLNANTRPDIYDELIQQAYDVLQIQEPEEQLEGFKQIENEMLTAQIAGVIEFKVAQKWRLQFRNLVQSSRARSSFEMFENLTPARNAIKQYLPISQRGAGMRYLWDNAEPRIEEENAERKKKGYAPLGGKALQQIYDEEAKNAVDDIRNRMATRAQNLVGTSSPPPVAPVVITSQSQYDALPVGTAFTLYGVFGTKK